MQTLRMTWCTRERERDNRAVAYSNALRCASACGVALLYIWCCMVILTSTRVQSLRSAIVWAAHTPDNLLLLDSAAISSSSWKVLAVSMACRDHEGWMRGSLTHFLPSAVLLILQLHVPARAVPSPPPPPDSSYHGFQEKVSLCQHSDGLLTPHADR